MSATYESRHDGYCRWRDYHGGEEFYLYVHRLLAVAEYGFEEVAGKHVHHKDGFRYHNTPENLSLKDPPDHADIHLRGGQSKGVI